MIWNQAELLTRVFAAVIGLLLTSHATAAWAKTAAIVLCNGYQNKTDQDLKDHFSTLNSDLIFDAPNTRPKETYVKFYLYIFPEGKIDFSDDCLDSFPLDGDTIRDQAKIIAREVGQSNILPKKYPDIPHLPAGPTFSRSMLIPVENDAFVFIGSSISSFEEDFFEGVVDSIVDKIR